MERRWALLLVAEGALGAPLAQAKPQCGRACLEKLLDSYLGAEAMGFTMPSNSKTGWESNKRVTGCGRPV